MKNIFTLLIILTTTLICFGQNYNYPGQIEIRGYNIGNQVDTLIFKKLGDLYFPNYLDGWTMDNFDKLPPKYYGLPIALWQQKSDSSIALTLLNDIILNITVSYMKEDEKEKMVAFATEKFGADPDLKSYEENHPLQSWITYWNLITWETNDVVFQMGNSDMRKPEHPIPTDIRWNLAYSDFVLEQKIINDFRKK